MVVHNCDLCIWEAHTEGSLGVPGQLMLEREFNDKSELTSETLSQKSLKTHQNQNSNQIVKVVSMCGIISFVQKKLLV